MFNLFKTANVNITNNPTTYRNYTNTIIKQSKSDDLPVLYTMVYSTSDILLTTNKLSTSYQTPTDLPTIIKQPIIHLYNYYNLNSASDHCPVLNNTYLEYVLNNLK